MDQEIGNEFHPTFEFAPIGMAMVSPEGKFLRVNEMLSKILGYSEKELLATDFQSLTHPDDLKKDLSLMNSLLAGDSMTYHMEKRYFHKSGKVIWAILGVSLIRNTDGSPKHFISQIQDITETQNTIEALHQREKQLSLVVNATHDGIWDWHIHENFEYLSSRFWRMLGIERGETIDIPGTWKKYIFPEDSQGFENVIEQHFQSKGEQPIYQELRFFNRDKKTVWMICRAKVVEWTPDGKPIRLVGSFTDISELKIAQETLLTNAKMVALGEMAGGIAHEINNPLTIIKGHADRMRMMLKKGVVDQALIESSVDQIVTTVARISNIIGGLRNFSRDSTELYFETHLLVDIVNDSLSFCQEKLKNHSISVEVSGDLEVLVHCSRVQISQVIVNLINNSFYAVQKLPEKWIKIELSQSGVQAKLSVIDSGYGIPNEIKSKIMDPFFTTKPIGEGTGLGLSISRGIIENHSGRLTLDEKSLRTKFDMTLPLLVG